MKDGSKMDLITNYSIPDKIFRIETDIVVSYVPGIEYVRNQITEVMKHKLWITHEKLYRSSYSISQGQEWSLKLDAE
jgi:hypothetical protein